MRRRRAQVSEEGELNLTPLIDCVFLLLIFFMVTTVFKEASHLRVELPEAREASKVEEKKLVLTVDQEGRMELNGKMVMLGGLEGTFAAEKASARTTTLTIRTDKKTKHGFVIDAMEAAKRAKIEEIVLATERKKEKG